MIKKLVQLFRWIISLVQPRRVAGPDSAGSVMETFAGRARQDVPPSDPDTHVEADTGGPENFVTMR